MPRLKEVNSLYVQCLNHVFEHLFEILTNDITPEEFELLRYYFISHLNGSIREHILKMAVLKDK